MTNETLKLIEDFGIIGSIDQIIKDAMFYLSGIESNLSWRPLKSNQFNKLVCSEFEDIIIIDTNEGIVIVENIIENWAIYRENGTLGRSNIEEGFVLSANEVKELIENHGPHYFFTNLKNSLPEWIYKLKGSEDKFLSWCLAAKIMTA